MARFRAHQEQIGDVGAGDEQHDADGGQENPQDLADVADHVVGERAHVRLQLQPREGRRQERNQTAQLCVCLGKRDTRLQPSERLKPEADTARRSGVERQWQQDIWAGAQELERRRQNADHFTWSAVDHE